MVGKTLDELGVAGRGEVVPRHFSVKESVFPFNKFPGVDIILGPEMRSTGEVMGIDDSFPMAFAKSQLAANSALPPSGTIFISVADRDKAEVVPDCPRAGGDGLPADFHARHGAGACGRPASTVEEVPKMQEGRPNLIDHMKNDQVALVINTPSGKGARTDEGKIRAAAVAHGVTCITTLAAAQAAVEACRALRERELTVAALQDRFPAGGASFLSPANGFASLPSNQGRRWRVASPVVYLIVAWCAAAAALQYGLSHACSAPGPDGRSEHFPRQADPADRP